MSNPHRVTLIPGDGVGPELADVARACVDAALENVGGTPIEWTVCLAGPASVEAGGELMPEATLDAVRSADATLKCPITTPIGKGFRSVNVQLRQTLDLYACIRPCKLYPGAKTRYDQVDLVIVRENCEDLYAGVEFPAGDESTASVIAEINARAEGKTIKTDPASTGISIKPISEANTERIIRRAFEYAIARGRRKVTAVHKANIMKHTDGLFKAVAERVAAEYAQSHPEIEFDQVLIDAVCMKLVQDPTPFDVLVTENLYGDILSDLCAGLVGGLGMAPGANIGSEGAVFEATHGSAPDIAGQDKVNPTAILLTAAMMLRHLGEVAAGDALENAISRVLADGRCVTADMVAEGVAPVGTGAMARAIIEAM
jgi:isocitrate dehydrogenase (NAD+)